jgi:TRAP-type C4-dicarboxylate transport system permease small subunit
MNPRTKAALPWIAVVVVILLVLAFLGWLGFEHWSELP